MRADDNSLLLLVKKLLDCRRRHEALKQGDWRPLRSDKEVFSYERIFDGERITIMLNFSSEPRCVEAEGLRTTKISLSTHGDRRDERIGDVVTLRPNEGLILEWE